MIVPEHPFIALLQVILIDITLAGDNAIVVGFMASRVAPDQRPRVIFWGIAGAVVLRAILAAVAVQLMAIVGLTLAGGLLLLWVCWKIGRELWTLRRERRAAADGASGQQTAPPPLPFWSAVTRIVVADLSMSLDNVLAVAGAAKGSTMVLVAGLVFSVALTATAATILARLLARHSWIAWLGLAMILYVALEMIWRGTIELDLPGRDLSGAARHFLAASFPPSD
ncbi:MAG TPA: YjbE family putative metal transport protein [Xanthobacteraceae bacterium]|nr:YjbE family putative metal transport protein [Xanthobacteraceae bacterium]